jgi:CBS domain-containing membrane protein
MVKKLAYSVSEREHWISGLGGLLGILAVLGVGHAWLNGGHVGLLSVASMGASSVLLFAVPHGPLSQPWALLGGHVIPALIGVTCARWLGADLMLTAAVAVALSITAQYILGCLHPPGGATAMFAVLGGDKVHALGYQYVWSPVLLDALVLLAVAIAFNYPFAWRRYPQSWHLSLQPPAGTPEKSMIPHQRRGSAADICIGVGAPC